MGFKTAISTIVPLLTMFNANSVSTNGTVIKKEQMNSFGYRTQKNADVSFALGNDKTVSDMIFYLMENVMHRLFLLSVSVTFARFTC